MELLVYGIVMLALLVMSAYFSASETALFSLPRRKIKGGAVREVLRDQRALLVTVLLGNMFINVFYSSLATLAAMSAGGVWFPVITAGALALLIVFGEVIPKNVAAAAPEKIAHVSAPLLLLLARILGPVRHFFDAVVKILTRTVLSPGHGQGDNLTAEELEEMVKMGADAGVIKKSQHELLEEVIEMAELNVREIMIPRVELALAEASEGTEGVLAVAAKYRVSKVPVFKSNTDNILGICHVKDLLIKPDADFGTVLRKPCYVPENMKVDALLAHFLKTQSGLCLVVDEYGALSGLVTIEDAAEEVVGDILDEYDEERMEIRPAGENRYVVAGSLSRRDFADFFGYDLPEEKVDTVAGFVLARLGRMPEKGDVVREGPFKFRVARVRAKRIRSIFVERTKNGEAAHNE